MKNKINRNNLFDHLVEYQLSLIGKTIGEAMDNKNYLSEWYLSQEQHDHFKDYALNLIKKVLICSKKYADRQFSWFNLFFGLNIKNVEDKIEDNVKNN